VFEERKHLGVPSVCFIVIFSFWVLSSWCWPIGQDSTFAGPSRNLRGTFAERRVAWRVCRERLESFATALVTAPGTLFMQDQAWINRDR
jgi:hypothetical protein